MGPSKLNTKYTLEDIAFLSGDSTPPDRGQEGKSFLALSAAMVWPGLGHAMAGNLKWAIFWCVSWTAIVLGIGSTLIEPPWAEDAWEIAMEAMAAGQGSLFDFWQQGAPAFLKFINA